VLGGGRQQYLVGTRAFAKTVTSNDVNTHRAVSLVWKPQLELSWCGVVYECELLELRCATSWCGVVSDME